MRRCRGSGTGRPAAALLPVCELQPLQRHFDLPVPLPAQRSDGQVRAKGKKNFFIGTAGKEKIKFSLAVPPTANRN